MQTARSDPVLQLRLSPKRIAGVAGVLAAVNLAMLLGTYLNHVSSTDGHWLTRNVVAQLTLAHENNLAVWYASMLLLAAACAMAACFATDRRTHARRSSIGWLLMAVLFAALSLDELGSLHERINQVHAIERAANPFRVDVPGWVGILALPAFLVCVLMLVFAWTTFRHVRLSFFLIALGLLLFASIPLQEAWELQTYHAGKRRSVAPLLIEEGSELFGTLCLLLGSLWFAWARSGGGQVREATLSFQAKIRGVLALEIALGLTMLATSALLPQVMSLQDNRGIPLNWFPAAMAAVVALAAALCARQTGQSVLYRNALWLWAAGHLVLSMDHGSAHRLTDWLARVVPLAPPGTWAVALGSMVVVPAVILACDASMRTLRWALAGWLALMLAAVAIDSARPWFAFAAYALMLPVLIFMMRGSARPLTDTKYFSPPVPPTP